MTTTINAFNAAIRSVNGLDSMASTLAAYAIQQAALSQNLDALKRIFHKPYKVNGKLCETMYKVVTDGRNGKLNPFGTALRNYIAAHYKGLSFGYDKETGAVTFKLKGDIDSIERMQLVDIAASRTSEERVYKGLIVEGVNASDLLDFKQFKEYSAPKKEKVEAELTGKSVLGRIQKMAESVEERGIIMSADESAHIIAAIRDLQSKLLASVANQKVLDIDNEKLMESLTMPASSKAKAAN